jgi:fumarylacetoacetate (FAA) hydrolase
MKLATIPSKDNKNRNGELVIVSSDNLWAKNVSRTIAPNLLTALEQWDNVFHDLQAVYERLNSQKEDGAFRLDPRTCLAPLPNAPGFYDGSAFLSHVIRARRARGDEMPASAKLTPLMYQGVSDHLLGPHAPIQIMDVAFGGDFEGEFAVITGEVPKGTPASETNKYFRLFLMFNDITLREIVKTEIETKFGFLQSKPNSSFAPFAVTADELGPAFKKERIEADLLVTFNGKRFGQPNGREMHFSFGELVAHACRTRPLSAGSVVGTGTISNESQDSGFACLTEQRFQEIIDTGKPSTPWLKPGDRVGMDVTLEGRSVFGAIDELVEL